RPDAIRERGARAFGTARSLAKRSAFAVSQFGSEPRYAWSMRLLGCSALVLAGWFTSACGSKGAVSLVATVSAPEVEVEQLTLGARLKGGFDLRLEVGPEAESGTEVSIENFAVSRGDMTLVAPLLA